MPDDSPSLHVDADFLSTLGNVLQLVGIFVAILANVTFAKNTSTALDEAEEHLAGLKEEVARVDLQVQRAKRGRPGR